MELKNRINEMLEDFRLSASDVAKELKISYSYMLKLKTGERVLSKTMSFEIANFFDCTVDFICGESNVGVFGYINQGEKFVIDFDAYRKNRKSFAINNLNRTRFITQMSFDAMRNRMFESNELHLLICDNGDSKFSRDNERQALYDFIMHKVSKYDERTLAKLLTFLGDFIDDKQ